MKTSRSIAVAMLLTATGAPAQQEQPAPAQPASDAPALKEKKICHTSQVTGSLTRKRRICLTAAEWRLVESESGHGFDNYLRRAIDAARPSSAGPG